MGGGGWAELQRASTEQLKIFVNKRSTLMCLRRRRRRRRYTRRYSTGLITKPLVVKCRPICHVPLQRLSFCFRFSLFGQQRKRQAMTGMAKQGEINPDNISFNPRQCGRVPVGGESKPPGNSLPSSPALWMLWLVSPHGTRVH